MSFVRWLMAANTAFITPKMPPSDMIAVITAMAARNCAFVSDMLLK